MGSRQPAASATGDETAALIARAHAIQLHISAANPLLSPSALWTYLSTGHERLLQEWGIGRFKRGLAQNYSTFAIRRPTHANYRAALRHYLRRPSLAVFKVRMAPSHLVNLVGKTRLSGRLEQLVYASYVGLLWTAIDDGSDDLPARLAEPAIGDPLPVKIAGRPVSQDLATSIHELRTIRPHLPKNGVLAEIGAGYGRLGQVVHAAGFRYWVFDIAPALTVSEWYLGQVFPNARHFRWRPFAAWEEVADEALAADFAYFSADQIALLPSGVVDMFAAISSLHEMTEAQCSFFLGQMTDKSGTAIYTKNWTERLNEHDQVAFRSADLLPPPGWRAEIDRQDSLWPRFTEKLFVRQS